MRWLDFIMSRKPAKSNESESFDWLNWRFHDNDPELEQFNSQLSLTTMGSYQPGKAPIVFNPLSTHNPVPKATLHHEMMHRELMEATTFGLFFQMIFHLRQVSCFRDMAKLCLENQWQVQEACATYAGLNFIAHHRPEYLSEAIRRLPSGKRHESPYREVFDALANVVPVVAGQPKSRLIGQTIFAAAIGHCSMNNDCLLKFAAPETLNERVLEQYLTQSSPNRRFLKILNAIRGHTKIDFIIERAYRDDAGREVTPVRPAIAQIARLVQNLSIVQTYEEVGEHARRFHQGWDSVLESLQPDDSVDFDTEALAKIPQIDVPFESVYGLSSGLRTIEDVRKQFVTAQTHNHGLWAVVAINSKDPNKAVKLDLLPYPKSLDANPLSDEASAFSFLTIGFRTGTFALQDIIAVFDEFADLPHAITFMHGSWFYWQQASAGHFAGKKTVQVCFDRTLSGEGLQVMLAFSDLRKTGQYFFLKFDDDQAVAVIADPKFPGNYVMQYLAGGIGRELFQNFVLRFGLQEMPAYEAKVPHIPLLKLIAFPAFVMHGTSSKT